jgi:hypothetical protein
MDRLKGEPGSGRRELQQKKACVFNPSNSTSRLIWTALNQDEKSDGGDCVRGGKCGLLQAERGRRRAAGSGERVFLEAGESKK